MFDLIRIETEQLGRFVHDALLFLVERNDVAHLFDIFPEISFVEFFVQNRLIERLKLTQGELLGEQFKTDVVAFQLRLKRLDGAIENAIVVKGERSNFVDIDPADPSCE